MKMPIPGEYWVRRPEFARSDLAVIPGLVYVTGVDMERGWVFGLAADRQGIIPGQGPSYKWSAVVFCQLMVKE
jgi:hypothetical protein